MQRLLFSLLSIALFATLGCSNTTISTNSDPAGNSNANQNNDGDGELDPLNVDQDFRASYKTTRPDMATSVFVPILNINCTCEYDGSWSAPKGPFESPEECRTAIEPSQDALDAFMECELDALAEYADQLDASVVDHLNCQNERAQDLATCAAPLEGISNCEENAEVFANASSCIQDANVAIDDCYNLVDMDAMSDNVFNDYNDARLACNQLLFQ